MLKASGKVGLPRLLAGIFFTAGLFLWMGSADVPPAKQPVSDLFPGLEPVLQSSAYQQYSLRPKSDFSKLLYLIDRLGKADAVVIYDGYHYNIRFVSAISKMFLYRCYKGQTPEQWILQWCHRTVIGNNLVWVRFPDGSLHLSKDVLMEELRNLEIAESGA